VRSTKITDLATKGGVKSLIHISIDQETKNLCQSKTNLFFQFSKLKTSSAKGLSKAFFLGL
jgi:hypothetical protein